MRNVDLTYKNGCLEYFSAVLTIVFVTLKLTNHINWSWWWVLSPLWINLGLLFLILFCIGLIYYIKMK